MIAIYTINNGGRNNQKDKSHMTKPILTISISGSVTFTESQRAKYQRITVRPDKTITVTIPRGGSLSEAKQFLKSKLSWVQKQLQKIDRHVECQDMLDLDVDLEKSQNDLFDCKYCFFARRTAGLYSSARISSHQSQKP